MVKNYTNEQIMRLLMIGKGYEARILKDDDYALKVFDPYIYSVSHKEEKTEILSKLDLPFITTPIDQITVDEKKSGYYMALFQSEKLSKFGHLKIEDKLELLKQISSYLKQLHERKIYVCDLRAENILVNERGIIKICDTDNFKVGRYNPEIMNVFAKKYFNKHKRYDEGLDIFTFNIMALILLHNIKFDDAFEIVLNYGTIKDSYAKELIGIILNNSEYEQEFITDNKELQKRLI